MDVLAISSQPHNGSNVTEGVDGIGGKASPMQFQSSRQTSNDANSIIEFCQGQIKFFEFTASQKIDRETRVHPQDKNEDQ